MTGWPGADALVTRLPPVRGRLVANAPLAPITWFRVGGPAEVLCTPADEDDLADFLAGTPGDVPVTVIGIGSNLLVRDDGVPGVVIRLGRGFSKIEIVDGDRLLVGTAVPDKKLASFALRHGLAGFSFYHGIPGSIGGALRMNAGANGHETCERLVEVHGVNRDGTRKVLPKAEMGFTYRHTTVPESLIFTAALFRGVPAPEADIRDAMDAVQDHRAASQPIRERTGGSTFKNPPDARAWQLIDAAGCRGLRIGGAQVSEMHCNFLINTGDASGHDIERLGETVRARVLQTSGVVLEWEIKRVGVGPEAKTGD